MKGEGVDRLPATDSAPRDLADFLRARAPHDVAAWPSWSGVARGGGSGRVVAVIVDEHAGRVHP